MLGKGEGKKGKFLVERRPNLKTKTKREFCVTVLWPDRPIWGLENTCVDMELIKVKHKEKTVDLVREYYSYIDKDSVQIFTDESKDPQTDVTGSAVAVPYYRVKVSSTHTTTENKVSRKQC